MTTPLPKARERFLETELIKKNRELSAMSTTLEDMRGLGGEGLGLFGSVGRRRKTEREEHLESEVKHQKEVISAMSSTLDELMLKSSKKASDEKTNREKDLEGDLRKKEEDLQALSSAL